MLDVRRKADTKTNTLHRSVNRELNRLTVSPMKSIPKIDVNLVYHHQSVKCVVLSIVSLSSFIFPKERKLISYFKANVNIVHTPSLGGASPVAVITQLVEYWTFNPKVAGSYPADGV